MKTSFFFTWQAGLLISFFIYSTVLPAQKCQSSFTITLENSKGGFFKGQKVTLTSLSGNEAYEVVSNEKGEATFTLPCNNIYKLSASNCTSIHEIQMPESAGLFAEFTLTYAPDMLEKEKHFTLNSMEQSEIDKTALALPDSFSMKGAIMPPPGRPDYFSEVKILLNDNDGIPLTHEILWLKGKKRGKTIKASTGPDGKLLVFLPKGDTYTLNFKYNQNYASIESPYSKGVSKINVTFSYLGTVEIERRKKLEEKRILEEEKRLKEEEERFTVYCKKLGITPEEGKKREAERYINSLKNFADTVICSVLNRNSWNDKLIVCDLTGSMMPYAAQLTLWYTLHHTYEKNLQFVFFNDGNNKADYLKKIGETDGIYYSASKGIDSLFNLMTKVSVNGSGGDCPENNMEALIKGVKMASPFKELVMIVDNNSPVKDIELLKEFNVPVHIILCGVSSWIMQDYLMIAWKTKGSLHTMEQDITKIASMMEGQTIIINKITYKIMGGEFVRVTKI